MSTVGVDFDGTLHPYSRGWVGYVPDDEEPTRGAREFLEWLREGGHRAVVFTCRADCPEGAQAVWEWLRAYNLADLVVDVTDVKPTAVAYVDDRSVVFQGSWEDARTDVSALMDGRAHGEHKAAFPGASL